MSKSHRQKLLLQMCCLYACLSRHSHLLALDIKNLQTEDKNSRGNICLELKYLSHLSCYLRGGRTRPILNTCPMSILNICFPFCIHSEVKKLQNIQVVISAEVPSFCFHFRRFSVGLSTMCSGLVQSGASSQAKHGGAYFLAVSG